MKSKLLIVGLITLTNIIHAQNSGSDGQLSADDISLSDLQAPTSPALTILGVNPEEISNPKTYSALETNLLNNFTNQGSFVIPESYALEFSPCWLGRNMDMSLSQIVNPTYGQSLWQNLAISVANTGTSNAELSPNEKRMSLGFRTMLWNGGEVQTERIKKYDELKSSYDVIRKHNDLSVAVSSIFARVCNSMNANTNKSDLSKSIMDAFSSDKFLADNTKTISESLSPEEFAALSEHVQTIIEENFTTVSSDMLKALSENFDSNKLQTGIDELVTEFTTLADEMSKRDGIKTEFAGAAVLRFPEGNVDFSYLPKYGLWLTLTKESKKKPFEFGALIRYMGYPGPSSSVNNADVGLKASIQGKKITFKGEYIYRNQWTIVESAVLEDGSRTTTTNSNSDYKFMFRADYKLSDAVMISYSFGQNFDVNTEFDTNLISALSLNIGIGQVKLSDVSGANSN